MGILPTLSIFIRFTKDKKGQDKMNKKQIVEDVTNYIEPIMTTHNIELVDVEFTQEGSNYFLRIYRNIINVYSYNAI